MRKLVVLTFTTLDGVMQAPGGPNEDPSGDFRYGGWTVGYWDDFMGKVMSTQMAEPFDLLQEVVFRLHSLLSSHSSCPEDGVRTCGRESNGNHRHSSNFPIEAILQTSPRG